MAKKEKGVERGTVSAEFKKCVNDMLDHGNSRFVMLDNTNFCEYTSGPDKGKKISPEMKP